MKHLFVKNIQKNRGAFPVASKCSDSEICVKWEKTPKPTHKKPNENTYTGGIEEIVPLQNSKWRFIYIG